MALLGKIKASTLMETMVATVLIIIIFMMASLIMNSVFISNINGSTSSVRERLQRLEYEYQNRVISIPHFEEWEDWEIEMAYESATNIEFVILEATNLKTERKIKTYTNVEE